MVAHAEVAHYTRIGTLAFLLDSTIGWSSAWATPVQFLNDRKEMLLGLERLDEVASTRPKSGLRVRTAINALLTTDAGSANDAFQMSFSGNPDDLGQWRGYAANGMGCSVITDALAVKQISDLAGWVLYNEKGQKAFARKILEKVRNVTDDSLISQILVAAACFMKDRGFQTEKEFRLLKFPNGNNASFRETSDRLVPYVDVLKNHTPPTSLPVQEIIIGPGWQLSSLQSAEFARNHVVQGIRRLLIVRGAASADIRPSAIPYDPR